MSVAEQLAGYITTEKHSTTEMLTLVSEFREQGLGIGHLRTFIVDLAVRGKLTRGHRSDQTAQTLFDEIQSERMTFFKNREIRPPRKKSLRPQLPFSIPEDWRSVSLEEMSLNVHYGYTASANAMLRDVRMLRITDIQNGKVNWETVPGCEIEADKIDQYRLQDNDLLIARTGGTIGKTFLISDVCLTSVFASYLIRVVPSTLISAKFLKLFFETSFYWRQLEDKSAGTGQPNVNATSLKSLVLPLPPLAEQKRIVSKVDRLMGICDRLESERRETLSLTDRSRRSVLASLTSSRDASELASSWRRLSDHFEILHDRPETLADLRQTILALAVQGKLVKQDPDELSADTLIGRLKNDRQSLVAEGLARKQKAFAKIEPDDHPFNLPDRWDWVRIGELAELVEYGTSQKSNDGPGGVPVLRMGNIQDGSVLLEGLKYVSEEIDDLPALYLRDGDLLFNRTNSWDLVGKTGVFRGPANEVTFASYLIRIRLMPGVCEDFLNMAMNAPYYRTTQINPTLTQQCGQANFNGTKMKNSLVPLAPTEEQHRIVAKADRLLAQCDRVAEQLRQRQATTEQLLTATIHRILADDIGSEERNAVN